MRYQKPSFSRSARPALLRRLAERYPYLQTSAVETLGAIQHLAQDWERLTDRFLEKEDLSQGRYYVLVYLFQGELDGHPEASPSVIADGLSVSRPTITCLLDGLERDGYLERRRDSQDRRALAVGLTGKGRELVETFMPEQVRRINAAMAGLDEAERQTLITLLGKIHLPSPPK